MQLQEADHGLTSQAMDGGSNRYIGDERLLVKFFNHPRLNQTKTKDEGRPIYEEVPYVQIMQPGNKDSIIVRPATERDKSRFVSHYRKFVDREEQETVEGTLLEEWPGLNRSQVEELKFFNIRTVEQLAEVSDTNAQNFMGINLLKRRAKEYLEASGNSAAAQEMSDLKDRNDALQAQLDELAATVEANASSKKRKSKE